MRLICNVREGVLSLSRNYKETNMEKIAVFPGSFDPFTIGHEEIVRRGLGMFDKIVVAVGVNAVKRGFLNIDTRLRVIKKVFEGESRVSVVCYSGLTVDFCEKVGSRFIIRGLRTAADFEYERSVGQINKAMASSIETVFFLTSPEHTFISSTIVRDVVMNGGDASKFLPTNVTREDLFK